MKYEKLGVRRGFYERRILPGLINFAMTREEVTRLRVEHIPAARGVVCEIGIGSGLNLPFYTDAVTRLYGIDSSAELLAMARIRAASRPFEVELIEHDAKRIPIADASVDTAVVTWALCSIPDAGAALREIRRALAPDGTLIFIEHGLAADAGVRTWQNRLTPAWRRFIGGCHLNRNIDALVRGAGFTITSLRTSYLPGPRALTFMYEGIAKP